MNENERYKLGFGTLRLPLVDGKIDMNEFTAMVDAYLESGFAYFDTAHGYLSGQSEIALANALIKRYNREDFELTNKLTNDFFKKEGGIRPVFESQLKACGTDYFDWYLMHSQTSAIYEKFRRCNAYETAFKLKEEGKVRHVGISFHDTEQVLEKILTQYPEIEAVQLQFNYYDYDDASVQAGKCYELCVKRNIPVFVMEPVKGGRLVNLPPKAMEIINELGTNPYSIALKYACSFDGVRTVLSGMSNLNQVLENTRLIRSFEKINAREKDALNQVKQAIEEQNLIQCTSCRYCIPNCPQTISIPDLFACLNEKKTFGGTHADFYYSFVHTADGSKASKCIECGACEAACPQHLPIRKYLKEVAEVFETGKSEH